jgi:hypothetical protein
MHLALPIQLTKEYLEASPYITIWYNGDCPANILTNGGGLDDVAALNGSQDHEDNGVVPPLPHNMMTELLHINLLAKNGRHVHKWLEFLESHCTGDRPIEYTVKLIIALQPKTQITYCKPTPSKSSKAATTSSRGNIVPSSFICKRWAGQLAGPLPMSKGTSENCVFCSVGML